MSRDHTEAELAQLRDSEDRKRQFVCYGDEDKASLGALFRELYLCPDGSSDFARFALEQLSYELTGLHTLLASEDGAELNHDIVLRIVGGIEHRTRVAAEVAKRMQAADEGGAS